MINEPRTYGYSAIQIGLIAFVFGIMGLVVLVTIGVTRLLLLIPVILLLGIVFIVVLYSITMKTMISDNGISTQSLLGTKSLNWNEISRISGTGYAIKFHNLDGDITVAPSQKLPGYEEIVELIGMKRPDLFTPQEYSEMPMSWLNKLYLPAMGSLVLGMGFFVLTQASDAVVPFVILVVIGIAFISSAFTAPQSLTFDGKFLLIKYLLHQTTLQADEVQSIELKYQSTRNNKTYFVRLTQTNQKTIRISGISPNLPVTYLVLKNWHMKNAVIGLTNPQN